MRDSKYWAKIDGLTSSAKFYRTIVIVLIAIVLILVINVRELSKRPPKIIVVPGATTKLVIEPGVNLPDEVLKDFAVYLVSLYASFTPVTFNHNMSEFLKYVDPKKFSDLQAEFLKLARDVSRTNYTQIFIPSSVDIMKTDDGIKVTVVGTQQVIIAGKITSSKNIMFHLALKEVIPDEKTNPYGLAVTALSWEELKSK